MTNLALVGNLGDRNFGCVSLDNSSWDFLLCQRRWLGCTTTLLEEFVDGGILELSKVSSQLLLLGHLVSLMLFLISFLCSDLLWRAIRCAHIVHLAIVLSRGSSVLTRTIGIGVVYRGWSGFLGFRHSRRQRTVERRRKMEGKRQEEWRSRSKWCVSSSLLRVPSTSWHGTITVTQCDERRQRVTVSLQVCSIVKHSTAFVDASSHLSFRQEAFDHSRCFGLQRLGHSPCSENIICSEHVLLFEHALHFGQELYASASSSVWALPIVY